jgi:putative ABC transport system permease protein
MLIFVKIQSYLRNFLLRSRVEADLQQEVHAHLEMLTDDNVRAGMDRNEAERAARIELGGIEQVKEQVREQRMGNWIHSVLSDCRYALRQLRKSSAFTAVAIFTLVLGIGANTAIFSFADLLLNHPVSLAHLNGLVSVDQIRADGEEALLAPANFRDLRAEIRNLDSFASYQEWPASLAGPNGAEEYAGVRVSEDFFTTLEAEPLLGRGFLAEEYRPGENHVALLSYGLWQREFAGDPQVVNKTLRLDGENYRIVGLMPANFQFPPGGAQFWVPLVFDQVESGDRTHRTLATVGRLSRTASLEQSRAELETLWNGLQQRYPKANRQWKLSVLSLRDRLVDEDSRQFAMLFLGVAGFVLLIACVNVANLQLARASSRERELSIRAAFGAGRRRIVRQLLTESLVLALTGAAGGLLLAFWLVALLRANMPAQVREISDISGMRVDGRAFIFTLLAATASGLLSGAIPAFRSARVNLRDGLEMGSTRVSGGGQRLPRIFVIAEVFLAVVLLIGAGLMVKGFYALASHQTAMDPQTLLTFHVNLSAKRYSSSVQRQAFSTRLLERLRSIPAVVSVSAASGLPYSFYENDVKALSDKSGGAPISDLPTVMQESIFNNYFHTLHLPLLQGRLFDERDSPGAPPVAIVSESLAQRLFPGEQAVGRHMKLPESNSPNDWITVVGVVANIRHEVYDRSFRSILYRPLAQAPESAMDFALRTSIDPHNLSATVRATVSDLDPGQPITLFQTMSEQINRQASALQFVAALMGLFGLIAILLSSAGIYGLVAGSVAERRREIGIRMALGARPIQVLAMVVRLAIVLVGIAGALGLLVGFLVAYLLSSLLYGVHAWDPRVYVMVPTLLLLVALLASFLPALRATRVDPMVALRYE